MELKEIFKCLYLSGIEIKVIDELYNHFYNIVDLLDVNMLDIKTYLLNELLVIKDLKEKEIYQTNYVLTNITNKGDKENEKFGDVTKHILKYLNDKTSKHYRLVNKNRNLIKTRLKEGYTIQDFEKVIDTMYSEWHGTEMDLYLRPETLFGTKFDGYLNRKKSTKNQMNDFMGNEFKKTGDLF